MNLAIKEISASFLTGQNPDSGIWNRENQFAGEQYIQVVAPSGSGKTSLLHFLYGSRIDYEGEIRWNDRDLRTFNLEELSELRRKHVAIVFQDLRLFPHLSLEQNFQIKHQLEPFHTQETIHMMAERLGIAHRMKTAAAVCSYGEQQRAAIIRAVLQPFDWLLVDEPFSHLDNANAEKALELILEETSKRKASLFFAAHDRIQKFPATETFYL